MKHSRVVSAVVLLMASGLFALSGCQNKVAQCNKLIEQLNAVAKTAHDHKGEDKESWERFAKALEDGRKKIEDVQLWDEKLKGFQTEYAKMTTKMVGASRKLAAGAGKADSPVDSEKSAKEVQAGLKEVQAALNEFKEAGEAEDKLVDDINGYCQK